MHVCFWGAWPQLESVGLTACFNVSSLWVLSFCFCAFELLVPSNNYLKVQWQSVSQYIAYLDLLKEEKNKLHGTERGCSGMVMVLLDQELSEALQAGTLSRWSGIKLSCNYSCLFSHTEWSKRHRTIFHPDWRGKLIFCSVGLKYLLWHNSWKFLQIFYGMQCGFEISFVR